ncbi:hypothetical protein [Rheinheimera sp.]|jgi:hypothetical protein|uniref:hypothetical protein n=1 Tax=Rheinheimera sp. TaxID=1869214 RepID=UPI00262A31F0|nr:hypothetical protein [Rheinheimera sp.]MCA1929631.1 hypothetical protein [Rheinheimera sp.]
MAESLVVPESVGKLILRQWLKYDKTVNSLKATNRRKSGIERTKAKTLDISIADLISHGLE